MATKYLTYEEAVTLHILLMRRAAEERFGVFSRPLVESALARPRQAAAYENADLIRQAATLCFGLIKNHPWVGGNKRTATVLTDSFLYRNGWGWLANDTETVAMVLAVESDQWGLDEIETWYRQRIAPL